MKIGVKQEDKWTTLYTGDTTSGTVIDVPNVTNYKFLCLIGYVGSNVGGSRFNVLVSTKQPFQLDYAAFLTAAQVGQINIENNKILLTAANAHVTAVYGAN